MCCEVVSIFPTTNFQTMRTPKHPAPLDGIIYGCVQAQSCSCCMSHCSAGICLSHFYSRDFRSWMHMFLKLVMGPVDISLQCWILSHQPNQPLCFTDTFLQCFFLIFILFLCFLFLCILVLCYNDTTQHIHSTFNHSEAWNNLKRKLNIVSLYFRAKEIKTQESDLSRVNYRNLEHTHRSSSFSSVLFTGPDLC